MSAQFALIGVWLASGDRPTLQEIIEAVLFTSGLCAAAAFTSNFNPWELLLAAMRLLVVGTVLGWICHRQQLRLRRSAAHSDIHLLQIKLVHLLGATFVCASLIALMRLLDRYAGSAYELLLFLMVLLLGAAGSLASLLTSLASLSQWKATSAAVTIGGVLVVAAARAWIGYTNTGSYVMAARVLTTLLVEASFVAISLVAIRALGYQLVRVNVRQAIQSDTSDRA
ncbi:hypothetical protein [Roseimaritima ulvae]|uniref:hypothetical protein n=1 Tax=Roseimaritima ulvae TaxID=980254 RepID=UPI0011CEC0D1|nr:hypothetical protein [Roseimaritima ulvae]